MENEDRTADRALKKVLMILSAVRMNPFVKEEYVLRRDAIAFG
jgi:hypothetical protein